MPTCRGGRGGGGGEWPAGKKAAWPGFKPIGAGRSGPDSAGSFRSTPTPLRRHGRFARSQRDAVLEARERGWADGGKAPARRAVFPRREEWGCFTAPPVKNDQFLRDEKFLPFRDADIDFAHAGGGPPWPRRRGSGPASVCLRERVRGTPSTIATILVRQLELQRLLEEEVHHHSVARFRPSKIRTSPSDLPAATRLRPAFSLPHAAKAEIRPSTNARARPTALAPPAPASHSSVKA